MIIGLMIAIFSPVKYSASAVLLLQSEDKSMNMGGLGALAGLAGINIGAMMGGGSASINPDLYADIIVSYPFLNELLKTSLYFEKDASTITLFDKIYGDTISGFGTKILNYTIRLPWTLKDKLFKKTMLQNIENFVNETSGLIIMDEDLDNVLKAVSEMISVEVDNATGLIKIDATMKKEPIAVAQLAQKVVDLLQDYIISYKTKQVQENLEFIEARYLEKKEEYESIRKEFFDYSDSHRNLVRERSDIRYQELSNAYDLSLQIYQSLTEQLEQARIAVKQETPVFSIIEPVKVPYQRSSPARVRIMIISTFLGGFLGFLAVFVKMIWKKIKKAW
jgi:hypothetical protein